MSVEQELVATQKAEADGEDSQPEEIQEV